MAPMDFGVSAIREGDRLYIRHDRCQAAARVGYGRGLVVCWADWHDV